MWEQAAAMSLHPVAIWIVDADPFYFKEWMAFSTVLLRGKQRVELTMAEFAHLLATDDSSL